LDYSSLWITFKLSFIVTGLLLILVIPIVYYMKNLSGYLQVFVESLVNMPLVLPPTVLGFYMLLAFGSQSEIGLWLKNSLGVSFVFSFEGIVFASLIYSFPFMINPILNALKQLPKHLEEAAFTIGKTKWEAFRYILLPNIYPSIWVGIAMTFAHTVGEFGVIIMVGGSIPEVTQVASIAIYNNVEQLNYSSANELAFILFTFSFLILLVVNLLNKRMVKLI
jgi:molybdate transport system permease protein